MKKLLLGLPILFLLTGCSVGTYDGKTAEEWSEIASSYQSDFSYCQNKVDDYQTALQEANDNIDESNQSIEDAQSYAGGTYYDMEYVLEDLKTADTVDDPY